MGNTEKASRQDWLAVLVSAAIGVVTARLLVANLFYPSLVAIALVGYIGFSNPFNRFASQLSRFEQFCNRCFDCVVMYGFATSSMFVILFVINLLHRDWHRVLYSFAGIIGFSLGVCMAHWKPADHLINWYLGLGKSES